jgi:hypothetical protein
MQQDQQGLDTLRDIRNMMERSSRFISLSGWSGIAAGLWAVLGALLGYWRLRIYYRDEYALGDITGLRRDLILIAAAVLVAALVSAYLFTLRRTRAQGLPFWGTSSRRLAWNMAIPLAVGGIFVLRLMQLDHNVLVAPVCLIFYGLALVNSAKYTLGEIRYLGLTMLVLGALNLWLPHYGLFFWALGFGACHIVYGVAMWQKYERHDGRDQ